MCQCNENYTGIGYIDCTRIPGTEEETKNGESNYSILYNLKYFFILHCPFFFSPSHFIQT